MFLNFSSFSDLALLFLRFVIAVIFLVHGWPKVTGAKKMVAAMGKPEMAPFFTGLGVAETVSAVLMVTGVYVQLAAIALSIVMIGAIYMKYLTWKVPFVSQTSTGWEFDLSLLAANLVILTQGAGSIALTF